MFKSLKSLSIAAKQRPSPGIQPAVHPRKLAHCSMPEARAMVPHDIAVRYHTLPLGFVESGTQRILTAATSHSNPAEVSSALRFLCDSEVKLIPLDETTVVSAIHIAYRGDERTLIKQVENLGAFSARQRRQPHEQHTPIELTPKEEPAKFLATLLEYAIAREASDIHFIPLANGAFVRLRVNGELLSHPEPLCSKQVYRQLIMRLKVLAKMDTTERQVPLEGALEIPLAGKAGGTSVHARVSTIPTVHGDKASVRLSRTGVIRSIDQIGLSEKGVAAIHRTITKRRGAFFCAGPTGSGKTTTLYAILAELTHQNLSIATVEDPVEVFLEGIVQTSLHRDLDYPTALRALLRHDPDVIMIGEIRDAESARVACEAALTGHLVLTSIHAGTVNDVFMRLSQFGIDSTTLSQSLAGIVCQRLLPMLCDDCKVIDLQATRELGFNAYKAVGCHRCDYAGSAGQVVASESVVWCRELAKQFCRADGSLQAVAKDIAEAHYEPLSASLHSLLKSGCITREWIAHE